MINSLNPVVQMSEVLGVRVSALTLVFSIFAGYPLALFHRRFLYGKPPGLQHIFFSATGFIIGYINFGIDIFHTTATLIFVYTVLKTIGGTLHSVVITMVFTLTYLLVGYMKTETESYDITWTMPHCILVLRLTGLAFDIYDGSFPEDQLSKDSKKSALREVPSLIEMAAYSYFPTSFLVGPQFPMKKYQDFVSGKLRHNPNQSLPDCVIPAMRTAALGLTYLAIHFIGAAYFREDFILSPHFKDLSFIAAIVYIGIWAHSLLQKYVAIWLLCEGACTLMGITYNGTDENGKPIWNGCANVNVKLFELSQNFTRDIINSFNINTNIWMLQYIYKRLRFLGNKYYSQIGVLLFLSLWHGLHSGYYMTFAMEFLVVGVEKDFEGVLQKNKVFLEFLDRPGIKQLKWIALKFYTLVFMGPCFAPLALRTFDKWWAVYKSTYFFAQIIWGSWFLLKPLVKILLPPQRAHVE